MRDARLTFGTYLALALAGCMAALLAAAIALDAITRHGFGPAAAFADLTTPHALDEIPGAAFILLLGAIGVLPVLMIGRAAVREARLQRRAAAKLRAASPTPLAGHDAWVVPGRVPAAFCHGLVRPRIYVSSAAVSELDAAALAAVVAHEQHHAHRHDPLRLALTRTLSEGLFFLPVLDRLTARYSDQAELAADQAVLRGGRASEGALASALLLFDARGAGVHPDRVDQLLGADVGSRLPTLQLLLSVAVLVLLLVTIMAGAAVSGHAPSVTGALSSLADGSIVSR